MKFAKNALFSVLVLKYLLNWSIITTCFILIPLAYLFNEHSSLNTTEYLLATQATTQRQNHKTNQLQKPYGYRYKITQVLMHVKPQEHKHSATQTTGSIPISFETDTSNSCSFKYIHLLHLIFLVINHLIKPDPAAESLCMQFFNYLYYVTWVFRLANIPKYWTWCQNLSKSIFFIQYKWTK